MNAETVLHIKPEPFAAPPDPYCFSAHTYPAFTDLTHLSNRQFNDCLECCREQVDYACSTNVCVVCGYATSYGKRYRCFLCHKVFHEACRNNLDLASSTGRWMCLDCKFPEKHNSSMFMPRIQNVITMPVDKSFQMPAIKSEKYDLTDCGSDKCDYPGCRSATLNSNLNASLPALDKPTAVVPAAERTAMDIKEEIVDKVAKSFIQKMNNAGRLNVCRSVPPNHFGPIPGIPVGTCWKYRLQVSESGIHRPLVAGICGRFDKGACSIVLSGVYPEDEDFGDEFYYSGCGGRGHDPHKRLMAQTMDQTLTRLNRALALNCNAPFNDQIGAEASDWRGGKPVRVVRNYKLRKHSKYAPVEGNRYDGIYKVVKYFPSFGQTGLLVWRYLLRRDDPEPAPWTEEGQRIIEEKNLRVIFPQVTVKSEPVEYPSKKMAYSYSGVNWVPKMEPYDPSYPQAYPDFFHEEVDIKPNGKVLQSNLPPPPLCYSYPYNLQWSPSVFRPPVEMPVPSPPAFQLNISSVRSMNSNISSNSTLPAAQYHPVAVSNPAGHTPVPDVRAPPVASIENSVNYAPTLPSNPAHEGNVPNISQPVTNNSNFVGVTIKEEAYELPASVEKLIDLDTANETIWAYCKTYLGKTEKAFFDVVKLMFICRCCCKLVDRPVTTSCNHNICLNCITKHFSQGQFSCPDCHYFLGPNFNFVENPNLGSALEKLFSGCNGQISQFI